MRGTRLSKYESCCIIFVWKSFFACRNDSEMISAKIMTLPMYITARDFLLFVRFFLNRSFYV